MFHRNHFNASDVWKDVESFGFHSETNTYQRALTQYLTVIHRCKVLIASLVLALGCTEPTPPYSIAGTWEGSTTSYGSLHLELTQSGAQVTGSGIRKKAGLVDVPFTMTGILSDSLLTAVVAITTGGDGAFIAAYRTEDVNAGSFTAHLSYAMINTSADIYLGKVTRK